MAVSCLVLHPLILGHSHIRKCCVCAASAGALILDNVNQWAKLSLIYAFYVVCLSMSMRI